MKQKKIWVVETGSYSDYRVEGVFSSRENALRVVGFLGLCEDNVSKWPLDPNISELKRGFVGWSVVMLKDGTVESAQVGIPRMIEGGAEVSVWQRSKAKHYIEREPAKAFDCISATVFARSRNHAIKIVGEYRARFIAEGKL